MTAVALLKLSVSIQETWKYIEMNHEIPGQHWILSPCRGEVQSPNMLNGSCWITATSCILISSSSRRSSSQPTTWPLSWSMQKVETCSSTSRRIVAYLKTRCRFSSSQAGEANFAVRYCAVWTVCKVSEQVNRVIDVWVQFVNELHIPQQLLCQFRVCSSIGNLKAICRW